MFNILKEVRFVHKGNLGSHVKQCLYLMTFYDHGYFGAWSHCLLHNVITFSFGKSFARDHCAQDVQFGIAVYMFTDKLFGIINFEEAGIMIP